VYLSLFARWRRYVYNVLHVTGRKKCGQSQARPRPMRSREVSFVYPRCCVRVPYGVTSCVMSSSFPSGLQLISQGHVHRVGVLYGVWCILLYVWSFTCPLHDRSRHYYTRPMLLISWLPHLAQGPPPHWNWRTCTWTGRKRSAWSGRGLLEKGTYRSTIITEVTLGADGCKLVGTGRAGRTEGGTRS
jgi:hypothetical protein